MYNFQLDWLHSRTRAAACVRACVCDNSSESSRYNAQVLYTVSVRFETSKQQQFQKKITFTFIWILSRGK